MRFFGRSSISPPMSSIAARAARRHQATSSAALVAASTNWSATIGSHLFPKRCCGSFRELSSAKQKERVWFNDRKAADLFRITVARMAAVGNVPYSKLDEETDTQ